MGTGTFNTTGNTNSGQQDNYALSGLTADDQSYLLSQLNTPGSKIRFLVAPADNTVAATFAGFTNSTYKGTPILQVNAVPEPASLGLVAFGGLLALRRRRA